MLMSSEVTCNGATYPVHPACAALPRRTDEEIDSLAEDINRNGLRTPIVLHDGAVVDGRHRLMACDQAGTRPEFRDFADVIGLWRDDIGADSVTDEDIALYVWSSEFERRSMTTSQRAIAAARLLPMISRANLPKGMRARDAAAKQAGTSSRTIAHATRVVEMGTPELQKAVEDGRISVSAASNIARMEPDDQAAALEGQHAPPAASTREAMTSSASVEHYTPAQYIEAARRVLGVIEFDPASCEQANKTVRAQKFLTRADDGLSCEWSGRTFMNSPYGKESNGDSQQALWLDKLRDEFDAWRVPAAIALNRSSVGTNWFRDLLLRSDAVCIVDHRIKHDTPAGPGKQPLHGSVFSYLGPDVDAFIREFSVFGFCIDVDHAHARQVAAMTQGAA